MTKQLFSKQQYNQLIKSRKQTEQLHNKIDKIFERHLNPFTSDLMLSDELGLLEPAIEIKENDKQVKVLAEIPGIAIDDIDVELSSDGYMTISGEKKNETEDTINGYYFSERSYGSIHRTIMLPNDLDTNKAEAKYDKGVLEILIPKNSSASAKIHKLQIK